MGKCVVLPGRFRPLRNMILFFGVTNGRPQLVIFKFQVILVDPVVGGTKPLFGRFTLIITIFRDDDMVKY
jgi:hypothetical protein